VVALVFAGCGGEASPPLATDLAVMLDLAVVTAESWQVAPGDYERRAELLHGWSAPQEDEFGPFATNRGPQGAIDWHLTRVRPLELVLAGRALAGADSESTTVRVSWNDESLGEVVLGADGGPEEHRLDVPLSAQRPGSNVILLNYRAATPSATPPQVAWSGIRIEGAGAGARPSRAEEGGLRLPFRTAVDYYFLVPDGGAVELDGIALYGPQGAWRSADPAPGLQVSIYRYPNAPPVETKTFTASEGRLRLRSHDLPVRLRLEPTAGGRLPEAEAGFELDAVLVTGSDPWPHAAGSGTLAAAEPWLLFTSPSPRD